MLKLIVYFIEHRYDLAIYRLLWVNNRASQAKRDFKSAKWAVIKTKIGEQRWGAMSNEFGDPNSSPHYLFNEAKILAFSWIHQIDVYTS